LRLPVVLVAAAFVVAACGDDEDTTGERPELIVSAAASLTKAFEDYAQSFDDAKVRFSFAGSDELAAQIRKGAKPDLYAAGNTALPEALFEEGKLEKPVEFAGNELVIAVPSGSEGIASVDDLRGDGIRLVIGDEDVPVGSYTREVLNRLSPGQRKAILANVKSEEPDVTGIVGKLTKGAATAAFLYATDVHAAGGELRAISLPKQLGPRVIYAIAVVRGTDAKREAELFIDGLLASAGEAAMRRAGFLAPPSP
jgi:molybdate transport system substrate-binding protein